MVTVSGFPVLRTQLAAQAVLPAELLAEELTFLVRRIGRVS